MGLNMNNLVDIHTDRCIGCTRCMRACPTEAIRIKNNKAQLIPERCIYCGKCILNCHKSAYKISSDSFANLSKHQINVVILPISIYGMITSLEELSGIYQTLYNYGFDEVIDLSPITKVLIENIKKDITKQGETFILSQCPTVIRLIQLKYPSLLPQLLNYDFPYEIGAKLSREKYSEIYRVAPNQIGVSYISECLSNFMAIKQSLGKFSSQIDHVFLFHDLLRTHLKESSQDIQVAKAGISSCKSGTFSEDKHVLSVDGIKQVDEVLEKIALNPYPDIRLIEAFSCIGGCVGGNFTGINPYISKWNVKQFQESINHFASDIDVNNDCFIVNDDWYFEKPLESFEPFKLSDNVNQSIIKMMKINELLKELPNIDCCACGSPSCRALAEDIVNHKKILNDCCIKRNRGDNK